MSSPTKKALVRKRKLQNHPEKQTEEAEGCVPGERGGESEKSVEGGRSLCASCVSGGKYLLLLIIIPPLINYASLLQESRQLQPNHGALYDIGHGHKLYLGCSGTGSPTVVLDAPTGMSSDVWALVVPELAKITKVCVYDRAGLGFSERPPYENVTSGEGDERPPSRWQPFTVERMADDFHRLITYSSDQERPLVLVGSEMGAAVARFYTQVYEGDVQALVLVDPLVEDLLTDSSPVWSQFWFAHLVPSFQSMQLSAAVGLTRLALILGLMSQPITGGLIPDDVVKRQKHLLCHPRHLSSVVDEHFFINETFSQMKTVLKVKPFPSNISVTVINGNYYDDQLPSSLNKAWAKSQQYLISQLHPASKHIVVNGADHRMLYRQPGAVVDPVRRIITQYRNRRKRTYSS